MVALKKSKASTSSVSVSKPQKIVVDCSIPVKESIYDTAGLVKFLREHIKRENKIGNLGEAIKVSNEGSANVVITSTEPISTRYVRYLVKKDIKKNLLRDWIRVTATKNGFRLAFYNANAVQELAAAV